MSKLSFEVFKLYAEATKTFFMNKLLKSSVITEISLKTVSSSVTVIASSTELQLNQVVYLKANNSGFNMNAGFYRVTKIVKSTDSSKNNIWIVAQKSGSTVTKNCEYLGLERLDSIENNFQTTQESVNKLIELSEKGSNTSASTKYGVYAQWKDGGSSSDSRLHRFVSTDGDQISFSTDLSSVLGVTSDTLAYVENYSAEKDNNHAYAKVSIVGLTEVESDGTCVVGKPCKPTTNGKATLSDTGVGYLVLKKGASNTVWILLTPESALDSMKYLWRKTIGSTDFDIDTGINIDTSVVLPSMNNPDDLRSLVAYQQQHIKNLEYTLYQVLGAPNFNK